MDSSNTSYLIDWNTINSTESLSKLKEYLQSNANDSSAKDFFYEQTIHDFRTEVSSLLNRLLELRQWLDGPNKHPVSVFGLHSFESHPAADQPRGECQGLVTG